MFSDMHFEVIDIRLTEGANGKLRAEGLLSLRPDANPPTYMFSQALSAEPVKDFDEARHKLKQDAKRIIDDFTAKVAAAAAKFA